MEVSRHKTALVAGGAGFIGSHRCDRLIHPQTEDYYGNVNPVGIRSCYDEGKFITQALRGEDFTIYGDDYQTRSFCR